MESKRRTFDNVSGWGGGAFVGEGSLLSNSIRVCSEIFYKWRVKEGYLTMRAGGQVEYFWERVLSLQAFK